MVQIHSPRPFFPGKTEFSKPRRRSAGLRLKLSLSFSPFRPFAPLLGRFRANATHPTKKP